MGVLFLLKWPELLRGTETTRPSVVESAACVCEGSEMSLFLSLHQNRHACMPMFVERNRTAESKSNRISRAAVAIQSIRRGIVERRRIKCRKNSAVYLQTMWRAFLSRQIATHVSMLRDKSRAQMLWYSSAQLLQKTFRGFYSRRYRHSYFERKEYLRAVSLKDHNVREVSEAVADRMFEERSTQLEEQEQREFAGLAGNLHHLSSTANTAGVYSSPYVEPMKAFGVTMEEHLQNQFKKSKYCHRHLKRALGSEVYARTYHRFGASGSLKAVQTGSYQHSSMPRPLDTYKLQPLYENN